MRTFLRGFVRLVLLLEVLMGLLATYIFFHVPFIRRPPTTDDVIWALLATVYLNAIRREAIAMRDGRLPP